MCYGWVRIFGIFQLRKTEINDKRGICVRRDMRKRDGGGGGVKKSQF